LTPDSTKISAEKDDSHAPEETSEPKVLAEKPDSPVNEAGPAETKETPEEEQTTPTEELASSSDKPKSEEEKPVGAETKTEENENLGNLTRTESLENTLESDIRSRASSVRSKSLRSVDDDTDTEIETNLQENLSKASSRSASPHEKDDFYDSGPVGDAPKEFSPVDPTHPDQHQVEEKVTTPVASAPVEVESAADLLQSPEIENKVQVPESPKVENKVQTPESPDEKIEVQVPESPKEENKVQVPESPSEKPASPTNVPVVDNAETEEAEKVSAIEIVAEANSKASSPVNKEELILDLDEPKTTVSSVENTPTIEKSIGEEKASNLKQKTPSPMVISPLKTNEEDLNESLSTPVEEQKDNLETPSDSGVQPTDAVEKPASLDLASKETTPSSEQTLESAATESVASPVQNSAVFSPEEILISPTDENSNVSGNLKDNQGIEEKPAELKDENSNNLLKKPSSPVANPQVLDNLGNSQNNEACSPVTSQSDSKELVNSSDENVKATEQETISEDLLKPLSPVVQNSSESKEVTKSVDETVESSVEKTPCPTEEDHSIQTPSSPVEQSSALENIEISQNDEIFSPAAPQSPAEVVTESPKDADQETDSKLSSPVEKVPVFEEHKSSDGQQGAAGSLMEKPQSSEQETDSDVVIGPSSPVQETGDAEKLKSPEICEKTEEENKAPETKLSTSSSKTFDENLSSPVEENFVGAKKSLVKADVNMEPAAEETNKTAEAQNSQLMLENEASEETSGSVSGTISCQENEQVNVELSPTEKQTPANQEQSLQLNEQSKPDLEAKKISNEAENAFEDESVTNQKTPETSAVNEMFEAKSTEAENSNSNIEMQC